MINILQLTKNYDKNTRALRGVDLDIGKGMFGLIGANGAGKTTLMRILAGIVRATSGKVIILGHDISTAGGRHAVKSILGYLPQELGLYLDLSAYEFLEYIAMLKGIADAGNRKAQISNILEMVGLTKDAKRLLRTYSGGMKRRIGIAQALIGQPQLLIVDEPTSGLDPEERVRFRNLLSNISANCSVILSTHIVEDISHSCNDLAVIKDGNILYRGSPQGLINSVRGKVWNINTAEYHPDEKHIIVSTMMTQYGIQYRVIGEPIACLSAAPIEPSLEDGYLWLMNDSRNKIAK